MPAYKYQSEDGSIQTVLVRPLSQRDDPVVVDGVKLNRVMVPENVFVVGGAAPVPSQKESVLSGYYRQEREQGSRFQSEFTKEQIKKIWSEP
jgi:hypothetical protein